MPSILYRLCEALLPDYEVERELATGGMGTVFLARDAALDRMVAIKIVRPELATAEATERFLNEARVLANLNHPNVVPVHRAGEAGGFSYYVMDFVKGETLADRLEQGPLSPQEVLKLGRDLLDALEAVHSLGIVHRDIKPGNIFIIRGRALLADFGISRSSGPQTSDDSGVVRVRGTPGYMPPEQVFGWNLTPRTDLYATAMVLYEAATGRRWEALHPDQHGDWSGVPGSLARILRRALAWEPAERWPDARTLRHALWRTRTRKYRRRTLLLTVSGLIVGGIGVPLLLAPGGGAPPAELAILPFALQGDLDSNLRTDLARATELNIGLLDYVPINTAIKVHEVVGDDTARLFEALNTGAYTRATVAEEEGDLVVRLQVVQSDGPSLGAAPIRGTAAAVGELGCELGREVVSLIARDRRDQYRCILEGRTAQAVDEWLEGERAFGRQDWALADTHFVRALSLDPDFAHAKWRLLNVRRWMRVPWGVEDLGQFYREQQDQLAQRERMLLEAWQTPFGHQRLQKYEEAVSIFHRDADAWLLYADDLFIRGPLVGIPLDSAVTVLRETTEKDSSLGPAFADLAWAYIHLGRREEARRVVNHLQAIAVPEAWIPSDLFDLAYNERFAPDTAAAMRTRFLGGGTWSETTTLLSEIGLRWGLSFDAAVPQAEFGAALAALPGTPKEHRANAHEARALALVALGRLGEALVHFDSAAILYGSREAALQSAQWRLLPQAFGMGGVDSGEVAKGRAALEEFAQAADLGIRASWTLALDAFATGDAASSEWWKRVRAVSGGGAEVLGRFLKAVNHARLGDFSNALVVSDSLVPCVVSEPNIGPDAECRGDPFLRAGLYLKRGKWRSQLDDDRGADREWLWYQNTDIIDWPGWPIGTAQAGEIDWAFGTYARFLRGRAALERRDTETGCENLQRVLDLWADADAAFEPLVNQASELVERSCR